MFLTEYSKDLPTYLKYCKDVVFAGLEPSLGSYEETNMMEILWKHYQNEEVIEDLNELLHRHAQTFVIRISWNYFQLLSSLSWGVSMKKLNCLADLDF